MRAGVNYSPVGLFKNVDFILKEMTMIDHENMDYFQSAMVKSLLLISRKLETLTEEVAKGNALLQESLIKEKTTDIKLVTPPTI